MENASKALVMAGGVLIGVLIISLAVYLFADFGSTSAEINAQNADKQLTEFNSRFTIYEGIDTITIYDIISLAEYVKENNDYYSGESEKQISISISGISGFSGLSNISNQQRQTLIEKCTINGELTYFRCNRIDYNNGRVSNISFSKNS